MLYNYGAAILRAVGDTKRPLLFLAAAGMTNVVLDLLLVIVIPLGVAGRCHWDGGLSDGFQHSGDMVSSPVLREVISSASPS